MATRHSVLVTVTLFKEPLATYIGVSNIAWKHKGEHGGELFLLELKGRQKPHKALRGQDPGDLNSPERQDGSRLHTTAGDKKPLREKP